MIIKNKLHWVKALGDPRPGYNDGPLEWSFDLEVNEKQKQELLDAGVDESKIKNKDDERGDFIQLKRTAKRRDGSDAKPIQFFQNEKGPDGKFMEWDPDVAIGNGTVALVKIAINETEYKSKPWFKPAPLSVLVTDLVEYETESFEDYLDEDGFEDA